MFEVFVNVDLFFSCGGVYKPMGRLARDATTGETLAGARTKCREATQHKADARTKDREARDAQREAGAGEQPATRKGTGRSNRRIGSGGWSGVLQHALDLSYAA